MTSKRKKPPQSEEPTICTRSRTGNLLFRDAKSKQNVCACEPCFNDDQRCVRAIYPIAGKTGVRLCTKHNREQGGVQKNLCIDCPPEENVRANYKDATGRCNRVCAKHARSRGCYETLNPCVICPSGEKKTSVLQR